MSEYQFFPEPPAGSELIHTRRYEVRTYKLAPDRFLLRGVIVDEKPAGLYVARITGTGVNGTARFVVE